MQSARVASLTLGLTSISACFSPNEPVAADTSAQTSESSAATTESGSTAPAESTGTSATQTTEPLDTSTSLQGDSSSGSTTSPSTETGEDSSSTGAETDCVGIASRTIWINFDGGTLEEGLIDNAPAWVTGDPLQAAEWPAYDAAEGDQDEIMGILREQWAPFDVCVTDEQPDVVDYEMVIVSSTTIMNNPNHPGYVRLDCGDDEVNNTVVRAMPPEANLPTTTKAISISVGLGFVFGLQQVTAQEDLMNLGAGSTRNGAEFTDVCQPLAFEQACGAPVGCANDEQNSYLTLLGVLGAAP